MFHGLYYRRSSNKAGLACGGRLAVAGTECLHGMAYQKALPNYLKILAGEVGPRFKSLDLSERVTEAFTILKDCELCSRRCRVDRTSGELGYCEAGDTAAVSSCFDHLGEEPFLVPSFTIFFKSCTFACLFCQNWEISQVGQTGADYYVTESELAAAIDGHSYCRNVNFVGGEPTPWLPFILKTLQYVKSDIPVVWNSNFYMSGKSMELLRGVVDVYLSDLKYGNDRCAARLSDVPDYSRVVRENHLKAGQDAELVIRHLVLPGHVDCCTRPVLQFIAENMGDRVVVNLMDQYRPCYKAHQVSGLDRRITAEEFESCVDQATRLGLNFIT